jgi:hypothetical protein
MKNCFRFAVLLTATLLFVPCANAGDTGWVTSAAPNYTPYINQPGNLSLDTSGNLRVTGSVTSTPSGTQTVTGSGTAGTPAAGVVTVQGATGGTPVPVSGTVTSQATAAGTPLTCSTTGASTANLTCTLAGVSGKTTYINGFSITCQFQASTAVGTTATLAGVITGTESYQVTELTNAFSGLQRSFPQPVPASAAATSIILTVTGVSGGTTCSLNAEGFQL